MSYFPCDIPFMDEEELKANGLSSLKETVDQDIVDPDTISRKDVIDAFYKLDIELRPSVIYEILCMINGIPPKGAK